VNYISMENSEYFLFRKELTKSDANPNQNKFIVPMMHVNNLLGAACCSYPQLASRREESAASPRKWLQQQIQGIVLPATGFDKGRKFTMKLTLKYQETCGFVFLNEWRKFIEWKALNVGDIVEFYWCTDRIVIKFLINYPMNN
jgi:hypothetical protein